MRRASVGGNAKSQECSCRSGHFCSDVCKLDTATGKWSTGFLRPPFINLAYHSATLIGAEIWVVGGSDDKHTSPHVYVLDTTTLKWRTVSIRQAQAHCFAHDDTTQCEMFLQLIH